MLSCAWSRLEARRHTAISTMMHPCTRARTVAMSRRTARRCHRAHLFCALLLVRILLFAVAPFGATHVTHPFVLRRPPLAKSSPCLLVAPYGATSCDKCNGLRSLLDLVVVAPCGATLKGQAEHPRADVSSRDGTSLDVTRHTRHPRGPPALFALTLLCGSPFCLACRAMRRDLAKWCVSCLCVLTTRRALRRDVAAIDL